MSQKKGVDSLIMAIVHPLEGGDSLGTFNNDSEYETKGPEIQELKIKF